MPGGWKISHQQSSASDSGDILTGGVTFGDMNAGGLNWATLAALAGAGLAAFIIWRKFKR